MFEGRYREDDSLQGELDFSEEALMGSLSGLGDWSDDEDLSDEDTFGLTLDDMRVDGDELEENFEYEEDEDDIW